jgi:predicted DCC family thiol-disulfide oxidoreductase YuxK
MKTLAHKIIIYDDVCPMCKAYTEGFVQLGWLPLENRIGFSQVPAAILEKIDSNRARHEIPLFDTETGETLYGKDALFYILGEQMPLLKPLFRFAPFRAAVFGLYQIITYNRRIIAGSPTPTNGFDCAPDFNTFYRWLYIGLATFIGVLFLNKTIQNIDSQWFVIFSLFFMAILRGLIFQNFQTKTGYFGHLATVFLIVGILFSIVGVNPLTTLFVPLLGMYIWTKRMCLI